MHVGRLILINQIKICNLKEGAVQHTKYIGLRAVVSGGAEGALAPPEFGSSVNPTPTGGGRLCPPHYC